MMFRVLLWDRDMPRPERAVLDKSSIEAGTLDKAEEWAQTWAVEWEARHNQPAYWQVIPFTSH